MLRTKAFVTRHAISALLLTLILIYSSGISSIRSLFDEGFVSTQFLPRLLVGIALVAILMIVWREERTTDQAGEANASAHANLFSLLKPIVLFIAILSYIAAFQPLGFIFPTIALSACCLWLFDFAAERRDVLQRSGMLLLVATIIAGLAYLLFAVAFGARLPLFPGVG